MTTLDRALVSRADLPALLVAALAEREPELSLRAALGPLELTTEARDRFVAQALSIGLRAARQSPPAARVELELSLAAALVLAGASHSSSAES
ncbi:MAG TPA: hypothetical protein VHV51_17060 [Polyangiaceae bacterium]|nr:hypothetical protein [Polyangiaceae bacterium]